MKFIIQFLSRDDKGRFTKGSFLADSFNRRLLVAVCLLLVLLAAGTALCGWLLYQELWGHAA